MVNFFRIFEIKFFCFVFAMSALVKDVGLYMAYIKAKKNYMKVSQATFLKNR